MLALFLFVIFTTSYAQMISQNPADYPVETTFSNCPGGSCVITLPSAKINQNYEITIPITISPPYTFSISNVIGSCSEIDNNHILTNTDNTISLYVTATCPLPQISSISFTLNVLKGVDAEQQSFTIPVIRDSLKVALAIDLSEDMAEILGEGPDTKLDLVKTGVNDLVTKLEEYQQGFGDSLAMSYFSTNVIQPNPPISDGYIVIDNTDEDFNNWSSMKVYNDFNPRVPLSKSALGEGLLNAKSKIEMDPSDNLRRIVFLFSDGQQNAGNEIERDGVSFKNSTDSLNNYQSNPKDSIVYVTVSATKAADVPPLMAAIASKNNGISLHIDGNSTEYSTFLNEQLPDFLNNICLEKIAVRITDMLPHNGSTEIPVDQNMILYLNQAVNKNTGKIYLKRTVDNSVFDEIDITSSQISGEGTSILTITPTKSFESGTEYFVTIDENAFKGIDDDQFAGVTSKSYWSFSTADIIKPTVELRSAESIVHEPGFDITISFSEEIRGFEAADITLSNGTAKNLSTSDSIEFTASIEASEEGAVLISIAENVVKDLAGNQNEASGQLTVTYELATHTNQINKDELKIYTSGGNIIIKVLNKQLLSNNTGEARVYSMHGVLLQQNRLNSTENIISLNTTPKLCIVKVNLKNKIYVEELLVD